ncbi:Uma2 family endonuclease [soil metagenome]
MIEELNFKKQQAQRHKFSVADYFALSELGLLSESTELIEGDIYDMTAHSPRHRAFVDIVVDNFKTALKGRATIFAQSTLAFEGWSPEPDLMVLKFDSKRYRDRQPSTEETLLIVEVSDTTLAKDKGIKLRSYALQGVQEYWIVNLVDDVIEVYREPLGAEYSEKKTYGFRDAFAPLAFPDDKRVWLEDF